MNKHPSSITLGRYHDDDLPPDERAAVELHLAACPACQAELAGLRSLSAMLARPVTGADEMPSPEQFWQALAPQLGSQDAPAPSRLSWAPGVFLLLLQALLALLATASSLTAGLQTLARWPLPNAETLRPVIAAAAQAAALFGGASLTLSVVGLSLGVLYLLWLAAWCPGRCVQTVTQKRRMV